MELSVREMGVRSLLHSDKTSHRSAGVKTDSCADGWSFSGPFWDRMNEEMFSTLSFHTLDEEEEERIREAKKKAANDEMAEKIKATFKASEEQKKDAE